MLTLTENASTILRDITEQASTADEAGLRITAEPTPEPSFALTTADGPEPGDTTVVEHGVHVYLDAASAAQLDDKVLDAAVDPSGRVEFALDPQR